MYFNLKRILIVSAALLLIVAVTGCEQPENSGINIGNESLTKKEASNLNDARIYGRTAISDFQKMFYQLSDIPFDSYEEGLESYGLNESQQEEFITYVKENKIGGYVRNIVFNELSERVKKENNGYLYQVTTEAEIKNNGESRKHYMTYELLLTPSLLKGFTITSLTYDMGHSVDGYDVKLANNAIDDILHDKLDELFKNGLARTDKNQKESTYRINSLFIDDVYAKSIINKLGFSSGEQKEFITSTLNLSRSKIDEDGYRASGTGEYLVEYKNASNQVQKAVYDVSIILQQHNPLEKDYMYQIDKLTISKK